MKTRHRNHFTTIRTEGALLPPDLLEKIAEGAPDLEGLRPGDYHLLKNEKLNEAISRSWNRLRGAWDNFQTERDQLTAGKWGTTETRDRWLLPLFQELGYGRLQTQTAVTLNGKSYAISHGWGSVPIHLLGFRIALDKRTPGAAGAARVSPHSLLQEFLNRQEDVLWAFLSNGLQLRILRDNVSLTRQAYVEFDLEAMMAGEVYADFVLIWLLCHQSRVEGDQPTEFWLEKWSQYAHQQGTRALDQLRTGVENAISELGSGFLKAPDNQKLRQHLRDGTLTTQDYYRQLLRMVYQLIFLFVAEDRELLFPPNTDALAQKRYRDFYSTQRTRRLAERSRGQRHADLYHIHCLVTRWLGSETGCPQLALPALGGFIFSEAATPDLDTADLPNQSFLAAIRALAFTVDGRVLRPVDYKNLGPEELGSVYESLLELHPQLNTEAGSFNLSSASGSERKTTGSYYTPTSLIQELLDSALDPVIARALKEADPEQTLLNLTVCDPASGSGHFLIAAAHRLARALAALRVGEDEPSPEATRAALRDVIGRCLYGVDVNPMAVELCKFSLWMEALDPGKPLTFLDAHIKCGNSLVGVGPGLDISEIPDEAFKPAFGDHKPTATALRRRNKRERKGQIGIRWEPTLLKTQEDLQQWAQQAYRQLEAMPEEEAAQLRVKEAAYQALISDETYQRRRLEFDLWTGAFFWPIPAGDADDLLAPTQQELNNLQRGDTLDVELTRRIQEISQRERFFHWAFEFPTVFNGEHSGFDVVLGNPPWERIKLQEKEFFAPYDSEIANAPNKATRNKLIKKLPEENPALFLQFKQAKAIAENLSSFVRQSGRFPLTAYGDINTYALFADHVRALINKSGRAGIIVPTGIATDFGTKNYFGDIVEKQQLVSLLDFENRDIIFPGVHRSIKFCLLTLSSAPVDKANFLFFATKIGHLRDPLRRYSLTPYEIARFNPNTRTLPVFRTRPDADLTRMIYDRVPVLNNEVTGENPWGIAFLRMIDMANDSHLFVTKPQPDYLRLYEDWMMHLFDHRYQSEGSHETTDEEYNDPNYLVEPRYWINSRHVEEIISNFASPQYFIGFRNRTRNTDMRSVVISYLPYSGVGNTIPLIFTENPNNYLLFANLSSLVLDFIARNKIPGMNLNFFIFKQFPVLSPNNYLSSDKYFIGLAILELIYTAFDIKPFAEYVQYDGPPFRWDKKRRALLRSELDAYYARLYGLNRKQLRYILDPADLTPKELADILDPWEEVVDPLDPEGYQARAAASTFPGETFRVLKNKEIKAHGEYRTRRLVLEAWGRMQTSIDTGTEYVPMVDPPPAHPSLAHPWPDGTPYTGPGLVLDEKLFEDEKPEPKPAVKEPQPEYKEEPPPPIDWDLYRCKACGQIQPGFARYEHVRDVHKGVDPGFEMVKES